MDVHLFSHNGEFSKGSRKKQHPICASCGKTRRHRFHQDATVVSDSSGSTVQCPTCSGSGTIHLSSTELRALLLKRG